eukprot:gene34154-42114_t
MERAELYMKAAYGGRLFKPMGATSLAAPLERGARRMRNTRWVGTVHPLAKPRAIAQRVPKSISD